MSEVRVRGRDIAQRRKALAKMNRTTVSMADLALVAGGLYDMRAISVIESEAVTTESWDELWAALGKIEQMIEDGEYHPSGEKSE